MYHQNGLLLRQQEKRRIEYVTSWKWYGCDAYERTELDT